MKFNKKHIISILITLVIALLIIVPININAANKCSECSKIPDTTARTSCEKNCIDDTSSNVSCDECSKIPDTTARTSCEQKCTPSSGTNNGGTGNNGTSSKTQNSEEYGYKVAKAKDKKISKTSCKSLFGGQTGEMLKDIYSLIKFAVPIILIAMSIKDFGEVIIGQDSDKMKKATSTFIKRLIISVVLLLGPTLIGFIFKIFGIEICSL